MLSRSDFKTAELPKTKLYTWARKQKLPLPIYETVCVLQSIFQDC